MTRGRAKLLVGLTVGALALPMPSVKAQPDAPPVLHADSSNVHFPSMMVSARVGGRAHASAMIDGTGHIADGSLRTAGSHELFANAAKAAMRKFSFEAARRDGRPISGRIDVEFEFRLPKSAVVPTTAVWRVEHDTTGYLVITGWDSVRHASPAPVLGDGDLKAVRQAIIDAVGRDPSVNKAPVTVEFTTFEAWTSDVLGAKVRTHDSAARPNSMGGGGRDFWCQANRTGPRAPWVVRCEMLDAWVSLS